MALLVSKYYDRAPDGSYSLSNTPRVQVDTGSGGAEPSSPPPTRQTHEYKTFLRVGTSDEIVLHITPLYVSARYSTD